MLSPVGRLTPYPAHNSIFVYSPLNQSRTNCSRWSMILSSFHGMARPSFAVKSTNVNHVPGLYLFPPSPPGRGQGEGYSYVLQSYRGISCRHFQGACGRRCAPVPNPMWGRGLSERSEFRSPNLRDRGKGTLLGPRPGAHGFGSFCRNKRTSACGAEPPQELFPNLSFPTFVIGIQRLVVVFVFVPAPSHAASFPGLFPLQL